MEICIFIASPFFESNTVVDCIMQLYVEMMEFDWIVAKHEKKYMD